MSIQETFNRALQLHQADQVEDAERLYQQVLSARPNHADALHLLGLIHGEKGDLTQSAQLIEQAIRIQPNSPVYLINLGETYRRAKRYPESIQCFRKAIALDPRSTDTYNNLAIALQDSGDAAGSATAARAGLQIQESNADLHFNLGIALNSLDDLPAAISAYQQAIALQPNYSQAHNNLGAALKKIKKPDEAIAEFRKAIAINPQYPDAYNNLGVALRESGKSQEAMDAYVRAIQLKPDFADAYSNLSGVLIERGQYAEAESLIEHALALNPNLPEALSNLVLIYEEKSQPDEALAICRRALPLLKDPVEAHNTMGNLHKDMGDLLGALACYGCALQISPDAHRIDSNRLYTMLFMDELDPKTLLGEHRRWARSHADELKSEIPAHLNNPDPDRRLKIGFVSPDFRADPVGRFLLPLFANHDHANYEIYCYSCVSRPDPVTDRLKAGTDVWRDILTHSDAEAARLIHEDQIDILIDLTMHMAFNRMLVFARRPAPVQATYLAYAGTTGLDAIDYRITDPWLDPPESSDEFYSEKSIRLAETYWCYEPVLDDLPLTPLPAQTNGHITFGCFNNFCKITKQTMETWMQVLHRVSGSVLRISAGTGSHRDRLKARLMQEGIVPDRLQFVGKMPLIDYMRQYQQIDIALDPFPYVGGTTSCDALWMGVPFVTLSGQTAISRGGASILQNMKLPDLIANSSNQYVEIVTELAEDRTRLIELRSALRALMLESPLMDGKRFAKNMEAVYRQMWRPWCER